MSTLIYKEWTAEWFSFLRIVHEGFTPNVLVTDDEDDGLDEEPSATINASYVGTRLRIGSLGNELSDFVDGNVHGF